MVVWLKKEEKSLVECYCFLLIPTAYLGLLNTWCLTHSCSTVSFPLSKWYETTVHWWEKSVFSFLYSVVFLVSLTFCVSLCSCCTAYPIFCGDWFVTHVFPLYSWPCPKTKSKKRAKNVRWFDWLMWQYFFVVVGCCFLHGLKLCQLYRLFFLIFFFF